MSNHVLLDNVTHRDLRVNRQFAPGRGFDVNLARAFPSEFVALQNEYPLFFVRNRDSGHFEPVALFGFADGENLFLDDGRWDAYYIPLSIARQPLLIGFQEQEVDGVPTRVPVVHIDLDHPSVSESEGEPLFLPHGGESEWLEQATAALKAIQEGHAAIEAFSKTLVGLELIEPVSLDMKFHDGASQVLKGLHGIDESRLAELGGPALETLHRSGYLQAIHMMTASMPNLPKLIERKNRALAGRRS